MSRHNWDRQNWTIISVPLTIWPQFVMQFLTRKFDPYLGEGVRVPVLLVLVLTGPHISRRILKVKFSMV